MPKTTKKDNKNAMLGICAGIVAIVAVVGIAIALIANNQKIDESYFVSDDTKYVLTLDGANAAMDLDVEEYAPTKAHMVYYYSGDDITGFKVYFLYDNADTAKKAADYLKENNKDDSEFAKIEVNGNYVVTTADKSVYENMTATEAKQQVELLQMLQNMNFDDSEDNSTSEE